MPKISEFTDITPSGDEYVAIVNDPAGTPVTNRCTTQEIADLFPTFNGALLTITSDQSGGFSNTAIPWDATDNADYWTATNSTRILIPAGVSFVEILGQVQFDSTQADHPALYIRKNGTNLSPLPYTLVTERVSVGAIGQISTYRIPITSSDYLELFVNTYDTGTVLKVEGTYLQVKAVG